MILVTGATGNVGREVVNLLLAGGEQVVAVTRHPAKAALPDGAHVVGGDPSRPQTLTPALRGVDAVFISPRALGDATAGAATAELLKLAAEQGAQRVVLLSALTVQYGGGEKHFADAFKAVEDACAGYLAHQFLKTRRERHFYIGLIYNFLKVYASIFDFL